MKTDNSHYAIRDTQNLSWIVGRYSTLRMASNKAEKKNMEYGAHRYYVIYVSAV